MNPIRWPAAIVLALITTLNLTGCVHNNSGVPTELNGQSLIVMGYRADKGIPYEGGMLYTGHRIDTLDGKAIGPPPMAKGDFRLVKPGEHLLEGYCYWHLRGVFHDVDDLQERGQLRLTTLPDHTYTIQSDIDEYKVECKLSAFDSPPGEDQPGVVIEEPKDIEEHEK